MKTVSSKTGFWYGQQNCTYTSRYTSQYTFPYKSKFVVQQRQRNVVWSTCKVLFCYIIWVNLWHLLLFWSFCHFSCLCCRLCLSSLIARLSRQLNTSKLQWSYNLVLKLPQKSFSQQKKWHIFRDLRLFYCKTRRNHCKWIILITYLRIQQVRIKKLSSRTTSPI